MHHRCLLKALVGSLALLGVLYFVLLWKLSSSHAKHTEFLAPQNGGGTNRPTDRATGVVSLKSGSPRSRPWTEVKIHLAVAVCGDRLPEAVTMLKSAAALTKNATLMFHVFAETALQEKLIKQLHAWPRLYRKMTEYRVYNITFPAGQSATWWTKNAYKPCANQRLFLPSLLTDVDAVIYVDTDVLFLSSLASVWATFSQFGPRHTMGLGDNSKGKHSWYTTKATTPYVHPSGVNSGVVFMNLTRIRQSTWMSDVLNYSHVYHGKLTLGDQDLFNIYFHFHPEQMFRLDCSLNYHIDFCKWRHVDRSSACVSAERQGVQILHGYDRMFHGGGIFRPIYDVFYQYKLGEDLATHLLQTVRSNVQKLTGECRAVTNALVLRLAQEVVRRGPAGNQTLTAVRTEGKRP